MNRSVRLMRRGFSLVELLVALAVSMVLIVAALMLFSETRSSQRAVDQISNASEVGAFVLRLVGRDIANAGFYPVEFSENEVASTLGSYFNLPNKDAYEYGISGCEGAQFNVSTGACGPKVDGAPDSIVIGYFTMDSFGGVTAHRYDCEGLDVGTAAVNTGRSGASASLTTSPIKPLFVGHHYYLSPTASTTMKVYDSTVATKSFSCKGLASPVANPYAPLISGVDDFQLQYGVYTPGSDTGSYNLRFVDADVVRSLGSIPVNGEMIEPWRRVLAVRVCVVSKTFEMAMTSVSKPNWTKCDGTSVVASDRSIRKTYTQTFGIKNHLNTVY